MRELVKEPLPLTADEFGSLLRPFALHGEGAIAVAVSGGPDSMALTFCLQRYLQKSKTPALCAFIVEHGLREESAREAASVAERLRGMGIEAEILPWEHEKIESRIHVRARDARYALLVDACKKRGINTLFLAHHADDQAETVLMRFAKGSGIDGLAGMAAVSGMDGVRLVRPLLTVPKARLLATCEKNALPFVIDPSNAADKYARGRLRRVMPLLEQEGFTTERLVDMSARAREAKEALDHYARAFLQEHVEDLEGGAYRLDLIALRGLPRATALRSVGMILGSLNRGSYAPERKQFIPFLEWLLDQDSLEARTFHGCLAQKGELCAKATFLREEAAIQDELELRSNESMIWDGRWQVASMCAEEGLCIKALGRQTHELLDQLAPDLRKRVPQGRVRATMPALWRGKTLVSIPIQNSQKQELAHAMLLTPLWRL